MAPGDLCNNLLHKLLVGVRFGERAHVLQVARGEALHFGEGATQVDGQAVDDFRTPAVLSLSFEDGAPDPPVEQHQSAVDGEDGAHLCGSDALPQVIQEGFIVFRYLEQIAQRESSNWRNVLSAYSSLLTCQTTSNSDCFPAASFRASRNSSA